MKSTAIRLAVRGGLLAGLFAAALWFASTGRAAQEQVLLPEESAAKANQIMQQAIQALGGDAYLNVRDSTCTGKLTQFDHNGELTGYERFIDYSEPPAKDRIENLPQRNLIDVFNGDKGWTMDRGGVSEEPPRQVIDFQQNVAKSLDNILRHRIHEPGIEIRYTGRDVVDLRQVDWVQLIDADNRTIRIAFDTGTHLPVRLTVESRDPITRMTATETEYYSLFFPSKGVQTPKQITRERNERKVYQVFFDGCDYNTGLQDSLFTKQSLDDAYAKLPNKEKYKDSKKKGKSKSGDSGNSDTPDKQ